MRVRTNLRLAMVVFLAVCLCSTVTANTIYVDKDTPSPSHGGTSWTNACNYLQDALEVAKSGDEIRVAEGTYYPDQSIYDPCGSGDRYDTFRLKNGVGIYGGYAGYGEPNENARDPNMYETILSGDLNSNDNPDALVYELASDPSRAENCYHVVTSSRRNSTAVLDGFTITAGNANGYYPEDEGGGGMYNEYGNPAITNCTFNRNSGDLGGGMYNERSSPIVTSCTFIENSADHGGGMCNFDYSTPIVTDCTFEGNLADYFGGAMCNFYSSDINITNCTFSANSAGWDGGGMYNKESSPTVTNCTFSENSASYYVGPWIFDYGNTTNSTFSSSMADYEGSGGGMCNEDSSPIVNNCTFSGNWADHGRGIGNFYSNPTVTNCTFRRYEQSVGDGMYNYESNPTVVNCTFSGYWEERDGAIYNSYSNPNIINCTFSRNPTYYYYIGIGNFDSSNPIITNCIIWGCTIYNDETSSANVSYSDVQYDDGTVYPGTGNINEAPRFVNADGPDEIYGTEDDNLRLLPGSPCIDAGDNNSVPAGVITDLDGRDRIRDGDCNDTEIVDMGAYEHGGVIYVDDDAPPGGNGSSWDKAYRYLQDALSVAGSQILVAEGTYKPDQGGGHSPGSRGASFVLINGTALYGGYAGLGAADPNARDIQLYETILSGDLLGNDNPNTPVYELYYDPCRADNCYRIVISSYTDATTILDGFTITAGYENGMYNYEYSSPTVSNCTFRLNSTGSLLGGGGMHNTWYSSPIVTNCTFSENLAVFLSGGMCNYDYSDPKVTNCKFSGNFGGGMCNSAGNPTVTNCTFSGNSADLGGGMCNYPGDPTVINCIFSGNTAEECGGGICNYCESSPMITNCTFVGNSAEVGGGMNNEYYSKPNITNCILWGNTALEGNEIALLDKSIIDVNYCDVRGGQTDIYKDGTCSVIWGDNIDADPLFKDDDNLRLLPSSLCIDAGNNAAVPAGVTTDFDGRDRIVDGDCNDTEIVDMGAYEFGWAYIGDFDGECDVDFFDYAVFASAWLTEQGDEKFDAACDISIPADNYIDMSDLAVFVDNWLAGI